MAKDSGKSTPTKERLVSPNKEEADALSTARPARIEDFVGQKRVVSNVRIMLEAAKKRGTSLEHILFSGPPGLGKTTLAHILANEMSVPISVTTGPLLERAGDLVAILTSLKEKQVLFIDEIHRLSRPVEETLYSAMEDFRVDVVIGKGPGARIIPLNLCKFTLIGATTRSGLLTAPLRDRFGAVFHLNFYDEAEIVQILERKIGESRISIEPSSIIAIAKRARGTPRVALRLLKRVWDYATVAGFESITPEVAEKALNQLGISEDGLDEMDRRVLLAVLNNFQGGPVGIDSISAVLNEERDTIEDVYEPYLLKEGYLEKTPRGRVATRKAYEYFKTQAKFSSTSFKGEANLFGDEK